MFKLETIGNKVCLVANDGSKTYPHREKIKACGGRWEKSMGMWWWPNDPTKRQAAFALVKELNNPTPPSPQPAPAVEEEWNITGL